MALIIESIYLSKNVISLQIKASEVYVKPLKPREALLTIKQNDDEEDSDNKEDEIKTRISLIFLILKKIKLFLIYYFVLKINQITKTHFFLLSRLNTFSILYSVTLARKKSPQSFLPLSQQFHK